MCVGVETISKLRGIGIGIGLHSRVSQRMLNRMDPNFGSVIRRFESSRPSQRRWTAEDPGVWAAQLDDGIIRKLYSPVLQIEARFRPQLFLTVPTCARRWTFESPVLVWTVRFR
jgi:hypothetical protein